MRTRGTIIHDVRSEFHEIMKEIDGLDDKDALNDCIVYNNIDKLCRPVIIRKKLLDGKACESATKELDRKSSADPVLEHRTGTNTDMVSLNEFCNEFKFL